MTDGNTHAIDQHLDEREDWDALQEVTAELEQAEARNEELEAKLAADRTEVIALIRKNAENGDISHGAAQWVIDTILAAQKGQDDE